MEPEDINGILKVFKSFLPEKAEKKIRPFL